MKRRFVHALGAMLLFSALYVGVSHWFASQCFGVDIHRYGDVFVCTAFVHLWAACAFLCSLLLGISLGRWAALIGIAVVVCGMIVSIPLAPTGWPFGLDRVATAENLGIYFLAPAFVGGLLGGLSRGSRLLRVP